MRATALLIGLLLLPVGAESDGLEALEAEQQRLYERVAPSVVLIGSGSSIGTGFFVSGDGLVLTNAHVVGSFSDVSVLLFDGRQLTGKVVERAEGSIDLALVQVDVESIALRLGSRKLGVGSWVASVGHGRKTPWSFSVGMVSNVHSLDWDRPVFQTQIPLNPGNSGGPIVDREGRVAGIVTSGILDANAINFAIRSEFAIQNVKGLARHCDCLSISAPVGTPVLVDGRMVGKGPRIVLPAEHRTYKIEAIINGSMVSEEVSFPSQRVVVLEFQ